jgi:hypothetical protein
VKGLSEYREVALRFKALAEYGPEREVRAELKRLSAELAAWIVAAEIKAMTVEEAPVVTISEADGPSRWRWRWRKIAWWPRRPSYAAPA